MEKDRSAGSFALVFGGSFYPPHPGHANMVRDSLSRFPEARYFFLVPNRQSPWKAPKAWTPEEILQRTQDYFCDVVDSRFVILDWEIQSENLSYTIHTLERLSREFQLPIHLILGEDSLVSLPDWYRASDILSLVESFVVYRRKTPAPFPLPIPNTLPKRKVQVLDNPLWDYSSTSLRGQI